MWPMPFAAWKARQAQQLLQSGDTADRRDADMRPHGRRAATTADRLTHEFPRFLARLGPDFPKVRFHDLRHSTHATQLLLAGVHPKIAQERLGHSTISTTLDLYSHVSDTMQEDAAAKIDAALRG
jgi:integrase